MIKLIYAKKNENDRARNKLRRAKMELDLLDCADLHIARQAYVYRAWKRAPHMRKKPHTLASHVGYDNSQKLRFFLFSIFNLHLERVGLSLV